METLSELLKIKVFMKKDYYSDYKPQMHLNGHFDPIRAFVLVTTPNI